MNKKESFIICLLAVISIFLVAPSSLAQEGKASELEADFDSLGGNKVILERARALEPEKEVSIVQPRSVNRRRRTEITTEFSGSFGGETYSKSRSLGLNANYHFTPKFSLGLKYNYTFNTLTAEGQALVDQAEADFRANPEDPTKSFPELDYAKDEFLALAAWYPLYGKINWFERGVVHFDLFALGGGGQVRLKSGATTTYTAGGGIGFWFTQHLTARLEMRYQTYTAKYFTGNQRLDLAVGSVQMGWLL